MGASPQYIGILSPESSRNSPSATVISLHPSINRGVPFCMPAFLSSTTGSPVTGSRRRFPVSTKACRAMDLPSRYRVTGISRLFAYPRRRRLRISRTNPIPAPAPYKASRRGTVVTTAPPLCRGIPKTSCKSSSPPPSRIKAASREKNTAPYRPRRPVHTVSRIRQTSRPGRVSRNGIRLKAAKLHKAPPKAHSLLHRPRSPRRHSPSRRPSRFMT